MRVYVLARELGLSSKELIEKLKSLAIEVKGHMSVLDEKAVALVRGKSGERPRKASPPKKKKPAGAKKMRSVAEKVARTIQIKIPITVKEISVKLEVKVSDVIKKLMKQGLMVTINQNLGEEEARRAAEQFGAEVALLPTEEEILFASHRREEKANLSSRSPVVTLMGHIDHGKTTLLDTIRKTNIVRRESGGITQHIGAYELFTEKGKIAFLDTPGHAAFTAMRARGARITDVVVLVVAADDGVMPQTVEAIDHARAAEVPIVVVINKIDLPNANAEKVKQQLAGLGLKSEDLGGKTITVGVSAKTGEGIDELLEMLLLEAEMLELKANPRRPARGAVVESRLSKREGPKATILVQNGTLRRGDIVICGLHYGKLRAMFNDRGERVEEASPATPVEILGLNGVPEAGEPFYTIEDEKKARAIVLRRRQEKESQRGVSRMTLEDLYQKIQEGGLKELRLILKADVRGSVGALKETLEKLATKEIALRVIHSGVGTISDSDVTLACASDAIIVGFHVRPETSARIKAQELGVDVRLYQVIYEAVDDVRKAMEGMLEPKKKETLLGVAKAQKIFKVSRVGVIAGSMVVKGKIVRNARFRLRRGDEVITEGKIVSLKHLKEDIKEAREGFECGIGLGGFSDVQPDDLIECFEVELVERKL